MPAPAAPPPASPPGHPRSLLSVSLSLHVCEPPEGPSPFPQEGSLEKKEVGKEQVLKAGGGRTVHGGLWGAVGELQTARFSEARRRPASHPGRKGRSPEGSHVPFTPKGRWLECPGPCGPADCVGPSGFRLCFPAGPLTSSATLTGCLRLLVSQVLQSASTVHA